MGSGNWPLFANTKDVEKLKSIIEELETILNNNPADDYQYDNVEKDAGYRELFKLAIRLLEESLR